MTFNAALVLNLHLESSGFYSANKSIKFKRTEVWDLKDRLISNLIKSKIKFWKFRLLELLKFALINLNELCCL